jgi:hypothetical protein
VARKLASLAAVVLVAAGCGATAKTQASTNSAPRTTRPKLTRIGSLPQAISKASAAALPNGRLMILGGYTGSASVDTIVAGPPSHLRVVGHLPHPTHDAAAVLLGTSVYFFGGGSTVSEPSVVRVSLAGKAVEAPALDEPLSDLGAVAIGGKAFLVGGYTGSQFASAVLRYLPAGGTHTVARLPQPLRYAGVTAIGRTIYVVGGLTTSGATREIYAVVPGGKPKVIGKLPAPEDHAALAALNGTLYYVGGRKLLGINPETGKVTVAAQLPSSLADPTATTVANEIVIAGGGTNGVWALTP